MLPPPRKNRRRQIAQPKTSSTSKGILWLLASFLLIVITFMARSHILASQITPVTSSPTPTKAPPAFQTVSVTPATDLDPNFARQVNECLIPAGNAYGFDLFVISGYRSPAQEDALYAQGRTVDGDIISNAQGNQSFHNFGFAVDLSDHEYGENIDYGELGSIATWCGIEHGDRGYTDLPHFEYRGDLSLEEFQAGMRPKPLNLPCALLDQRATANQALTKNDLKSCGAPLFSPSPNYTPGSQAAGTGGE